MSKIDYLDIFVKEHRFLFVCPLDGAVVVPEFKELHDRLHEGDGDDGEEGVPPRSGV